MLKNKVVVITGGCGLLGQEFAKMVLQNLGIAVIADINVEKGKKFTKNLRNEIPNGQFEFQPLDISNKKSIISLIENLNRKYNKIDALINNAYPRNINYGRKFEDVTYKDFCENLSLNLGGYFLTSQQFLNYFSEQGFGNIINITSIYGLVAPRFEIYNDTGMTMPVEYAAIKSALIHLTKYMAKYYSGKKIRVNSVSLGGVFDNQPERFVEKYRSFCLNKGLLEKTDISGTLLYLLSDMSTFLNGQNIVVDDGFTL